MQLVSIEMIKLFYERLCGYNLSFMCVMLSQYIEYRIILIYLFINLFIFSYEILEKKTARYILNSLKLSIYDYKGCE